MEKEGEARGDEGDNGCLNLEQGQTECRGGT